MKSPLRILHLEDDPKDAELVQETLASEGIECDVTRVENESTFVASLKQCAFDLIFADYTLPSFDGLSALKIARRECPQVPFLFVSGTLDEEVAIQALKDGATDYVFKTRLSRMVPSVQRAIREAQERTELVQSERALRRSEAYLAEAQKLSQTGSFGWNVATGDIYWSRETLRIFEYEPNTKVTLDIVFERIHPEDRDPHREMLERVARERCDWEHEHRLLMPDGRVKYLRVVGHPSQHESGDLEFVGAVIDITERRRSEQEMRKLASLVENSMDFIGMSTLEAEVLFINRAGQAMVGLDGDEQTQKTKVSDYFAPENLKLVEQVVLPSVFKDGRWEGETIVRHLKTGASIPMWQHIFFITEDGTGRRLALATIGRDMRERKRAEEELRRSESYLAEAQRLSHSGSWVWEVAGRDALHLSDEWYRIYEFDAGKGMPKWAERLERVHPEDREKWRGAIEQAIRNKCEYRVEFRILLPDGRIKFIDTVGHPILNSVGELVQFVGSSMDITERKKAEETLRRSEGYLAEAQRLTRSGSWAWNVRSGEIFWSQEIFRIYETDPKTMKPTWEEIIERTHPEDREEQQRRAILETTQKERVDSEGNFRIVLPDGRIKHLHTIAHPVTDASGEITEVVGTVMDVTEQHEARAALETAFGEIRTLRDQLYKENIVLREEIDKTSMFEEIVGDSASLQVVLARVAKVAPTDSTVLITGETGTGKELVARAIHKRSLRASRAFVSVNCAAIPATLIASELFGHEKGAFTGALSRRLGRFELAEGGTIFLDEIGELPAETQITLLRVLQEREFERIGGTRPIQADLRVIAATNRNLDAVIAAGTFRRDLFYRLNVFPIEMPALRERKEDIPTLVNYFIDRFSRKAGKKIGTIEKRTMELLESYSWPGNIRELQNVIERSVIVCDTDIFSIDPSWLHSDASPTSTEPAPFARRSEAKEREAIESALEATGGRVSGANGAAARLGMPASTLESKIRVLKINKYQYKSA
jgi:formate hydrogenlyase transcriptional activator